jgi:hypothetical protein
MTRSRTVILASASLVGVGAVVALGAFYLDPARAAVGPLPGEALVLPADTRAVFGFDVKRFTSSPLYRRYADRVGAARPEALRDIQEKTGIDPEKDLDRVVMATGAGNHDQSGIVLFQGRFDRSRIAQLIEKQKPQVTWKKHEGVSVYMYREGTRGAGALAFLDDDTLAAGSTAALEGLISRRAAGQTPLRSNAKLMELLGGIQPSATFWMVGDQSVLGSLPGLAGPGGAAGAGPMPFGLTLPSLQSLVVTAELDPMLALQVTGEATDGPAAKNLADMVSGLVAMASLQAAQRPELKDLATAVKVTTEANRVHVSARFPYELLDSLQPRKSVTAR